MGGGGGVERVGLQGRGDEVEGREKVEGVGGQVGEGKGSQSQVGEGRGVRVKWVRARGGGR